VRITPASNPDAQSATWTSSYSRSGANPQL
jgi:hypothetical protein